MIRRALAALLVIIALVGAVSCGGPSEPTPLCQTNNTSTITFHNTSTRFTYDISLDRVRILTGLAAGVTSSPVTVAANVAHSVEFLRGSTVGCLGNPIPVRCDTVALTCGT